MSDATDPTRPDDAVVDEGGGAMPARRQVDVPSLVAGIVVLVLCAAFAFGDLDELHVQSRVVWPTVLLGAGVALILTGRRR